MGSTRGWGHRRAPAHRHRPRTWGRRFPRAPADRQRGPRHPGPLWIAAMTQPFKLAIQEDMLPGPALADRFAQAASLGFQGIEFWSETLPAQEREIRALLGTDGVVAASI